METARLRLIFVGRSLNMIRSANFALGTAVNRVAILAECAAAGFHCSDVAKVVTCGDLFCRCLGLAGSTLNTGTLSKRVEIMKFHFRCWVQAAVKDFQNNTIAQTQRVKSFPL